jgi:hypothetical protein
VEDEVRSGDAAQLSAQGCFCHIVRSDDVPPDRPATGVSSEAMRARKKVIQSHPYGRLSATRAPDNLTLIIIIFAPEHQLSYENSHENYSLMLRGT